jgi:hypothetical protein
MYGEAKWYRQTPVSIIRNFDLVSSEYERVSFLICSNATLRILV